MVDATAELINRRRRQILVHSCIYYRLGAQLIDDYTFDRWAQELVDLQRKHPDIAANCVYAVAFSDFDGSTGFDLPYHLPEITATALRLLRTKPIRNDITTIGGVSHA